MRPGIVALFLPAVILVAACSSGEAAPSRSPAPTSSVGAPVASALASRSGTPSPVALLGEVHVTMTDTMRFAPDPITVKAGVPITFIVKNAGLIVHEFVVGTEAEQADHAEAMAMGHMAHEHDRALSVEPGKTSSMTMTFAEAGSILIGCHEPGHYDAGMKATLIVID